jgi:hypothetical protein
MRYTEQLERDAEQTRSQIADTLDELRARMTPGQLVDQAFDYARDGFPGQVVQNLKLQAVRNPLPLALMGASLAWLMLGNGREPRPSKSTISETAKEARDRISDKANAARDRVGDTAGSVATSVRQTAGSAYEALTATTNQTAAAMTGSAKNVADVGRSFMDFCSSQPFFIVGLGIALGAALGAMLPSTETEDRLMGEASDTAKDQVQETAKTLGERASEAAQEGAEKQGFAARPEAEAGNETAEDATLIPEPGEGDRQPSKGGPLEQTYPGR